MQSVIILIQENYTRLSEYIWKLELIWEGFHWEHIFDINSQAKVGIYLLKGRENISGSDRSRIKVLSQYIGF